MIQVPPYLMENEEEIERLEMKTDVAVVRQQAIWAGIAPGMRVADVGCGSGLTTRALFDLVQPGGTAVGLDASAERIAHAQRTYGVQGLSFECCDVLAPLPHLAPFDFVWVRFFLEYHGRRAFDIVTRLAQCLKPGGILCLIDLDHNCLNHYAMPDHLSTALHGIMQKLAEETDFDPCIGIKLYSFLYDLGFEAIDVALAAHHLIYGPLNDVDRFNWTKKLEVAVQRSGYPFENYPGGYEAFATDFQHFFAQPRRFTYTPLIACRGRKPGVDVSAG